MALYKSSCYSPTRNANSVNGNWRPSALTNTGHSILWMPIKCRGTTWCLITNIFLESVCAGIWMVNRKSWASMRHWQCDCTEEQGRCVTTAAVKHRPTQAAPDWGATHKTSVAPATLSARQVAAENGWMGEWMQNITWLQPACLVERRTLALYSANCKKRFLHLSQEVLDGKIFCDDLINPPWTSYVGESHKQKNFYF